MHRSDSATGWDQAPVKAGHPTQIPASEVTLAMRSLLGAPVDGVDTVAQIGAAVGLPDPAHFSRIFRTRYGISPRELRRGPLQTGRTA